MLDTYVSQVLHQELRNDDKDEEGNVNADANVFYSTYSAKDSSIKPEGIKKMLKVRQYLITVNPPIRSTEKQTQTLHEVPGPVWPPDLRPSLLQLRWHRHPQQK